LERIQEYTNIEQEPKPTPGVSLLQSWPTSGELVVENLSAKYSADGPEILHSLNFHIKSGERVGVVGRTGNGKNSLTLVLLRCILTKGNVVYDGIPTRRINLDALRTNITIIPQVPELLNDTLQGNLDPFGHHDDATLNNALRAAGLFTIQSEDGEGKIMLETDISGREETFRLANICKPVIPTLNFPTTRIPPLPGHGASLIVSITVHQRVIKFLVTWYVQRGNYYLFKTLHELGGPLRRHTIYIPSHKLDRPLRS